MTTRDDEEHCRHAVGDGDHDRYLTTLFAAAPRRRDLLALYAFNLEIARTREIISEPMTGEIRLQWWRDAVAEIYDGGRPRAHPVVGAVRAALDGTRIPQALLMELIEGRVSDLYDDGPKSMAALVTYAGATGGVLQEIAVHLLAPDASPEVLTAGRDLGTAWALVGLIRAMGFHGAMGRHFMPVEELHAAGIDPESLYRGDYTPELGQLVASIRAEAESCLRRARVVTVGKALPAFLLGPLMDGYLAKLDRAEGNPFAAAFETGGMGRLARLVWAAMLGRY